MKAYQAGRVSWLVLAGLGLAVVCGAPTASAKPAPGRAAEVRALARTLVFRPSDLPGFKLVQSGSLDTFEFTHTVIEGQKPDGFGWRQEWKRPASREHPRPTFIGASALLCESSKAAEAAVREKMSTIAAFIEWRDRLSTSPPAAAHRLFVSPRDRENNSIYHVFGAAGKLAFHLDVDAAGGTVAADDAALVDRLVRLLLLRYTRMK